VTRILSRLQHGPVRLSELRRMFPEASKKMLTQHLREMEKDGLVVRKDLSGRLRHVEYFLSDSLGFAVLHLIGTLTKWAREYLPTRAARRSRLDNRAARIAKFKSENLPDNQQGALTKPPHRDLSSTIRHVD
jgi:DNA-binding HxlR family transcriptional regulator